MNLYQNHWRRTLIRLSLIYLLSLSMVSTFAPLFTTHTYYEQKITEQLQMPSSQHWMGTDQLGRDLYSRIIYGARMSLAIGLTTAFFSLFLGTLTGAVAGYFGGFVDLILMRLIDMFYIFPTLLLAILLTLVFGRGFTGIFIALALSSWVTQARLIRGMALQIREMPYVESAKALGYGHLRVLVKHVLPNLLGPVIVALTLQIPSNILSESFLSFMGLGLSPPYASWGTLANEGYRAMRAYPHLMIFPGAVLFLTILAFHIVGEGLRDAIDPHEKSYEQITGTI